MPEKAISSAPEPAAQASSAASLLAAWMASRSVQLPLVVMASSVAVPTVIVAAGALPAASNAIVPPMTSARITKHSVEALMNHSSSPDVAGRVPLLESRSQS